jgi:hypothetical protein
MRVVVLVVRVSLAVAAEIRVVADGTLVASALDVVVLALAEWSIAVDADMARLAIAWSRDRLVQRCEAVAWVDERGVLDALGAVVPVWAVQALVADTEDWLL